MRAFMAQRGQPLPANMQTVFVGPSSGTTPSAGTIADTQSVDMQTLFATVIQFGGSARIAAQPNGWAIVAHKLGLAAAPQSTNAQAEVDPNGIPYPPFVPSKLAQFFHERFTSFEEFWLARMKTQASNNGQASASMPSQQQPNQPPGSSNTMMSQQQQQQALKQSQSQQPQPFMGMSHEAQSQAAQESARKAQELQAQLPQQLQQLQEMMKSGRLTQDQAKERYLHLQNAAKMAIIQAQAHANALNASNANQTVQASQSNRSAGNVHQSGNSSTTTAPEPSGSSGQANGADDNKKGAKRPRKSTASKANNNASDSDLGSQDVKPNIVGLQPNPSFPAPTQGNVNGALLPPNIAQINLHAQQAVRLLHQGMENPTQQLNAFAAIRTAQLHAQGIQNADVTVASQLLARVYNQFLTQAQASGQPIGVVAPAAFSAAQQELEKYNASQQLQGGSSGNSTTAMISNGFNNQSSQSIPGSEKPNAPPSKYKVEYMPIRRDVRTYGGWDLDAVEAQLGPMLAGKGRLPRSVRELGSVDIEGLIMSLRSRIEVEVTYALNTLLILTASVQAPGFHLLLSLCEDLCEELLELLVENAFFEHEFVPIEQAEIASMPETPLTYGEWIAGVLEDEDEMKFRLRKRMQLYEQDEDGGESATSGLSDYHAALAVDRAIQRHADISMTIVEILRNVAIIPDNHVFLNSQPSFLNTLMTIVAGVEHAELARKGRKERNAMNSATRDTVFTSGEALLLRKEVLGIVASLAGETLLLSTLDPITVSNIYTFLVSFVLDAGEIEQEHGTVYRELPVGAPQQPTPRNPHPAPPIMSMQPFSRKVPQHADLALEAFSSLAQPDANRRALGQIVAEEQLIAFGETLIKLLPVSDLDFHMLKTEARLGFSERVAMSLFDVAYSGNANVKRRLRQLPGTRGVIFRCIKRLMKIHADFSHNPFSVLTRRLVETMRILSDGENLFDRPPLLGFGMEGHAGRQATATKSALKDGSDDTTELADDDKVDGPMVLRHMTKDCHMLIDEESAVVDLMTQEGIDPTIISEFEKML
jgi:hypothetical protein